jgi:hypothetical protein
MTLNYKIPSHLRFLYMHNLGIFTFIFIFIFTFTVHLRSAGMARQSVLDLTPN